MKKDNIGYWIAVILLVVGAWLVEGVLWKSQNVPLGPVPVVTETPTPTATATPNT